MAGKIEKALYGPSLLEVFFGALLGLVSGVLVACVYLVFKPVLTVKELPKDRPRGAIYFLPGSESSAKGASWQAKQKQFLEGKTVQVGEDELNAWTSSFSAAAAPKADTSGGKAPPTTGILTPSKPNFKMVGDKMQIGMKCTLNWSGLMTDVTLQSTGNFRKEGDVYVFVPETVYMGSCPLHMLPAAAGAFVSFITDKQKVPDEFRAAWHKLSGVVVVGGALKLVAAQ